MLRLFFLYMWPRKAVYTPTARVCVCLPYTAVVKCNLIIALIQILRRIYLLLGTWWITIHGSVKTDLGVFLAPLNPWHSQPFRAYSHSAEYSATPFHARDRDVSANPIQFYGTAAEMSSTCEYTLGVHVSDLLQRVHRIKSTWKYFGFVWILFCGPAAG